MGDFIIETEKNPRSYHDWGYVEWLNDSTVQYYYYYERDHQGSVRTVRNASFGVVQSTAYTASGLPVTRIYSGVGDHHLHTGKPWQDTGGLAWYNNRARWYDPITMRFLAPDPLADKYHDISPWAWCGNNPLRYSDPTGKIIIFAPNSSEQFLENFNTAYNYLKEHNASELFDIVSSSKIEYHIEEITGDTKFNAYNNTIYWNPTRALLTETIYILTPSELLNHEFDHAISYNNDPEATLARKNKRIESYGNVEEKRVIEGSEFETAKKLGRLERNQVTRVNHFGTSYKVPSPDSDEIETVIVHYYVE